MKEITDKIKNLINFAMPRLLSMQETEIASKQSPDDWSKKEILGHLIDSAANNHQKIVRACYHAAESFPTYSQTDWVKVQHYNDLDWSDLLDLWQAYNRHLCAVIERLPQEALTAPVNIGKDSPVTLAFVVTDYPRHLEHHLKDLLK
ncbi:MAG: DinB family protein [Anaerolineae bacterium]|nr:DinB family protein [Anaerolineae bacterium]